ncbi:hypothetical protein OKW45_002706 [Paraburkholderia sp. WSM4175]
MPHDRRICSHGCLCLDASTPFGRHLRSPRRSESEKARAKKLLSSSRYREEFLAAVSRRSSSERTSLALKYALSRPACFSEARPLHINPSWTRRRAMQSRSANSMNSGNDSFLRSTPSAAIRSSGSTRSVRMVVVMGPRQVRINILDGLRLNDLAWFGQLDDVEFLSRLFELEQLPSSDARFKDAAGDIWQHRMNNDDWSRDWLFSDGRFNLVDGPAERFLRFLCEMVHPLVRPDRDDVIKLVSLFNEQLRQAGWELYEEERIAGRPRFAHRRLTNSGSRVVSRARTVADALDAGWMAKEIERLEHAAERDPALAIGTAKELIETCCKTLLTKRGIEFSKSDDLGDQSTVMFWRRFLVSSCAIFLSVSSVSSRTADSLLASAS